MRFALLLAFVSGAALAQEGGAALYPPASTATSLGAVPTTRSVGTGTATSTGLSGGGALSGDLSLVCATAGASSAGCVSTGTQTFAGTKTFSSDFSAQGATFNGFVTFAGSAQLNGNLIGNGSAAINLSQGAKLGATGTAIAASYSATSVIDFASTTTTTADSAGITVTGATAGMPCIVGAPVAAMVTGASFTCYVSAADTVKVRFTATGAAVDPASGTFTVRTF